ncbi:hypothetical protein C8R46DRAFT_1355779 [Mycena filopes]|nr:hypothetical protein C8R46DRAFT_1355779 [Mycena filopes]
MAGFLENCILGILFIPAWLVCSCISHIPTGGASREKRYHRPPPQKTTLQADRPTPPPPPLPRIDLSLGAFAEQPEISRFLHLPLDVRRHIYGHALGGRLIKLTIDQSSYHTYHIHAKVRSRCYELVADPDTTPNRLDSPAAPIPVALLLTSRQVYLEALPLLHSSNTFYIPIEQFEAVVHTAFQPEALPHIRSVYLPYADPRPRSFGSPWWSHVVVRLRTMTALEALTFEFGAAAEDLLGPPSARSNPHGRALDSVWGRGVLSLRTLHFFALFFAQGDTGPHVLGLKDTLRERVTALMIGVSVNERYAAFLAMSGEMDMAAALESASSGKTPWL